jgi:tRNA(adenine34) deaminase
MEAALDEARKAGDEGEVPVGAVLVRDGVIIARGRNARERTGDPTAHAEMMAIRAAVQTDSPTRWRLQGTTLFVTLEPCVMCMGAVVQARVTRVVFGCADPKGGAAQTLYTIGDDPRLNHRVEVIGGVLAEESANLLRSFFARLRAPRDVDRGGHDTG